MHALPLFLPHLLERNGNHLSRLPDGTGAFLFCLPVPHGQVRQWDQRHLPDLQQLLCELHERAEFGLYCL
jgi:hypothetical protein